MRMRKILGWMAGASAFAALAMLLTFGGAARAQEEAPPAAAPAATCPMIERCQEMMAARQAMHEEMAAEAEELDRLVAAMDSATGEARVDAMAAVLQALVSRHRAMHARMAEGGMGMAMGPGHGMHHGMHGAMHPGMPGAMHPGMACGPCPDDCPMMKGSPAEEPTTDGP